MPNQANGLYEFGSFRLDTAKRLLSRGGESVTLAPKTFDLLLLLVEGEGRVLTKRELMNSLWADTFVEEASLSYQIATLRKALGKEGDEWIETVPKHGYRFAATVTKVAGDGARPEESTGLQPAPNRLSRQRVPWLIAGVPTLLALVFAVLYFRPTGSPQVELRPVSRWTVPMMSVEPYNVFGINVGFGLAVSRDGTRLAYAERWGGSSRIVLRNLEQMDTKPIPGTEGGLRPFFSPDGQWLAYFTGSPGGSIRKVAITGGTSITLCENASYFGGSWGDDDRIVFSSYQGIGLMRVPAAGGKCESLSAPDRQAGEATRRWPQILPGGQLLFTAGGGGSYDSAKILVLDLRTGRSRVLVNGSAGRYVPSGHLVYVRRGTMFAVPFDIKQLSITGRETPVIEGIFYNNAGGFAEYTFSNSGLLLYMAETRPTNLSTLDWLDHNGTSQTVSAQPQIYGNIRLSPNGQRAAVNIMAGAGAIRDIWIIDLMRGTLNRLTSEGVNDNPIWTMDGRRVAFYSTQGSFQPAGIYWAAADGSSKPELLLATNTVCFPDSWTPDGRTLLYHSTGPAHIWAVRPTVNGGDGNPRLLFERSAFNETQAQVSPDGRWVAYASDDSGKNQIYVRAFPGPGGKVPISVEGGENPRWSRGGRELFYLDPAKSRVMAVDIQAGPMFRIGQTHALFEQHNPDWDVAPDGQHFLVRKQPQTVQNEPKLQVVVNWFDELRRRVPAGDK